jgi:hypothetical protein
MAVWATVEAGAEGAEAALFDRGIGVDMAADQAARQHAVGGDADAELPAERQDLVLDVAREQ